MTSADAAAGSDSSGGTGRSTRPEESREAGPPAVAPHRTLISDPAVMRALAHPARLAVLDHLASARITATATEFARVTGLSPSAMSYHLRALARIGMIEEAPGAGDARERRWRRSPSISGGYMVESSDDPTAEEQSAEQELVIAWLATEDAQLRAWLDRQWADSPDWRRAASLAGIRIQVTSAELSEINERVFELLRPYQTGLRDEDAPAGSRSVSVQYRAVPLGDPPDPPGQPSAT